MNENLNKSLNLETNVDSDHNQKSVSISQGTLLSEYFENADTILNQLKTMTLGAILFKDEKSFQFTSQYEKCLLANYKNRMGFYISCLFDPEFDIFTPPRKVFLDDCDINLFFEFYDPQFKIISKSENGISAIDIGYEINALPILECLETGSISRELFNLLEKMKFQKWDNGIIVSKCIDFRIHPQKEFLIKLTAGPELINHFSNIMIPSGNIKEKLEFEKQVLLLQNPKLCTDPSQDVARIYSDVDWRKKIWKNHEFSNKNLIIKKQKKEEQKIPISAPIDSSHQPNINNYQNEFDSVFNDYQV